MEKTKFSIVKAIAVLIVLFCANITKAQAPPDVVPYPFTDEGQFLTIDQSSPYWEPLMDASTRSRETAQAILNEGGTPSENWTCNGNVCCLTTAEWCTWHQKYHYTTTCIHLLTGVEFNGGDN